MRRIFKYDLSEIGLEDEITLEVPGPLTFHPISVAAQGGRLMLWAECDEGEPKGNYTVHIRGTGHPLGKVGPHIGSAVVAPYVWHVYKAP